MKFIFEANGSLVVKFNTGADMYGINQYKPKGAGVITSNCHDGTSNSNQTCFSTEDTSPLMPPTPTEWPLD
jgi:hypothetical protein